MESTTWVFYRNPKKQKSKKIVKIKIKIKEDEENFGLSSVESNGAEVERKMKSGEEDENIRGIVQKTKLAFMDAQKDS